MKFDELEISEKLKSALADGNFVELTEVQKQCIPAILAGKDVVGQGETGSGKTLAFVLPLLEKVFVGGGLQILVLTPTRELCVQVADVFDDFGKVLGVRTLSVFGGVGITAQLKKIRKVEVVVATPGRLLDILGRKVVDFSDFEFLVVDETDKMFEMGFIDDVKKIISHIPGKRQTLMFSATISSQVQRLMDRYLEDPVVVRTKALVDTSKLNQSFFDMSNEMHKFSLLTHLLKEQESGGLAIVFCATRVKTDVVCRNLRAHKVKAAAIHGGMSQNERLRTLEALKKKKLRVLVATDVAARGLDIKDVTNIYNYDVPPTSVDYVHRIGRTARAGEEGSAVTLLTRKDYEKFSRLDNDEELVIEKSVAPQYPQLDFDRNILDSDGGRSKNGNSRGRGKGGYSKKGYRKDSGGSQFYRQKGGNSNGPGKVNAHKTHGSKEKKKYSKGPYEGSKDKKNFSKDSSKNSGFSGKEKPFSEKNKEKSFSKDGKSFEKKKDFSSRPRKDGLPQKKPGYSNKKRSSGKKYSNKKYDSSKRYDSSNKYGSDKKKNSKNPQYSKGKSDWKKKKSSR